MIHPVHPQNAEPATGPGGIHRTTRAPIRILAVAGLAAWAGSCATSSASLTSWEPAVGQSCGSSPNPEELPAATELLDVDALASELGGGAGGYAVFDVRRDTTGTWHRVRLMEADAPDSLTSRIDETVRAHLLAGTREEVAVELRVDLEDPPRVRTGPHWDCAPALRNAGVVMQSLQTLGSDLGITGSATIWVFVREDGTPGEMELRSSSLDAALDATILEVARRARFYPALAALEPVEVWASIPFNVGRSGGGGGP